MSKYLINSIGLALIAAGQSMVASAADIPDLSSATLIDHRPGGAVTNTPTVAPATIAAAQLDGEGLPWDERIHASTKTQTQKGAWTKKKGVDELTINKVLGELRQKYPAPAVTTVTPPATGLPGMSMALPGMAVVVTPYQELCAWLAANTGDGKVLTSEWVGQQFASANTTLADLAAADAGLLKQWLDAFKGVLAQMS